MENLANLQYIAEPRYSGIVNCTAKKLTDPISLGLCVIVLSLCMMKKCYLVVFRYLYRNNGVYLNMYTWEIPNSWRNDYLMQIFDTSNLGRQARIRD